METWKGAACKVFYVFYERPPRTIHSPFESSQIAIGCDPNKTQPTEEIPEEDQSNSKFHSETKNLNSNQEKRNRFFLIFFSVISCFCCCCCCFFRGGEETDKYREKKQQSSYAN